MVKFFFWLFLCLSHDRFFLQVMQIFIFPVSSSLTKHTRLSQLALVSEIESLFCVNTIDDDPDNVLDGDLDDVDVDSHLF